MNEIQLHQAFGKWKNITPVVVIACTICTYSTRPPEALFTKNGCFNDALKTY